jgi:transposase InsO family protein
MNANTSYPTLRDNSIRYMLKFVAEYEQVRDKKHPVYKTARSFFSAKGLCYQNFYKLYRRYVVSGRNPEILLPTRRGPKPKYREMPLADNSLDSKVLAYRSQGHNKYVIAEALKKELGSNTPRSSASTIFRILRRYGQSKLTKAMVEEKRKIVRKTAGSLAHIDCHYLPRGIIKTEPMKRYFLLGVIDDYSRIVWTEVIPSTKAIEVTYAMMDALLILNQRYDIKFEEALTDNGSEFCGGAKTLNEHPYERLLIHFAIKHRRTKPYRPQTNGKIERFWRTFDDEVIEGALFNTLDELKEVVLGYNFYYNEHRPHQGINGKIPQSMLAEGEKPNLLFKKEKKDN